LVEAGYKGPELESLEGGRFGITQQFVTDMIAWFRDGHSLPRRYVWEIVLGAHGHFVAEESLVQLDLDEGMTCDVIGECDSTRWLLALH
jgi:serine/threonine-protein phosphatase 5